MARKLSKEIPKSARSPILYRILYPILSPLFRVLFRIQCTGLENVPMTEGCIVCPNHISNADAIAIGAMLPSRRALFCLGKAELVRIPIIKHIVIGMGAIPINRGSSDVGAIRQSIAALADKKLLAVFPQGTRQQGKNPADTEFKDGVGLILSRAKCSVLPVSITTKHMRVLPFRKLHIDIGKPIPYEAFDFSEGRKSYADAALLIRDRICELARSSSITLPSEVSEQ